MYKPISPTLSISPDSQNHMVSSLSMANWKFCDVAVIFGWFHPTGFCR